MSALYYRLSATLLRYMSPVTTDTVLQRALREACVPVHLLDADTLGQVTPCLERGIKLFVSPERQAKLRSELADLAARARETPAPVSIAIRIEADISDARLVARKICSELGTRSIVTQKVTTIVSELARNIVSYTSGGAIDFVALPTTPARLRICASDNGPGIRHMDDILAGRYKSKTGLGKGLLGVKRLSDVFSVQTGSTGTRVELEVSL
jgi:serine/threonine-protein kinase RsbT